MAAAPKKRRRAPTNPLEAANRKTDEQFIRDHLQPSDGWTTWTHPHTAKPYALCLKQPARMTHDELQACYDLVEKTSGDDYRASADGWHPKKKMVEMKSAELRYILVRDENNDLRGFTSLMPTWEDGEPVVYCYEIHLEDELHGYVVACRAIDRPNHHVPFLRALTGLSSSTGLAVLLMGFQEAIAQSIPIVEKVMLTCFKSNTKALAFYRKLGFVKDALSPDERRLRGGKVFVPDYLIMSRIVARPS
ncbi:GNAT family acetyltransferase nat4 [Verticillium dahliae]